MATERQSPDALLVQTNLTGAVAAIQDDPDSPDGNWLTADSNNANSVCRVSFPTPTGNPTTGAGLQEFRCWARLTANGTACSYDISLYENGTLVSSLATGSLTSTTGQILAATWDASLLGTADGSLVEVELTVTKSGGAPSSRTTGEVGAAEWNVDYSAGTDYTQDVSDTEGITDALSTVMTYARGLSDTEGITDALVRTMNHRREVADAIGVTDSAQAALQHIRRIQEALGVTDSNFAGRIICRLARTPR